MILEHDDEEDISDDRDIQWFLITRKEGDFSYYLIPTNLMVLSIDHTIQSLLINGYWYQYWDYLSNIKVREFILFKITEDSNINIKTWITWK